MSTSVGSGVEGACIVLHKIANVHEVLVRIRVRVRVRVTLSSTVYMNGAGGRGSKLQLSWFVGELLTCTCRLKDWQAGQL